MDRGTYPDEQVQQGLTNWVVVKIDVAERRELAESFEVVGIPVAIVLTPAGAFFHHFGSEEDLGFAVVERHMERRRQELDQIEQEMPPPREDAPLERVCRRLDAIAELVRRREHRKGGCIIGNLSTALADTHEAFRQRLADCFDEMARQFLPGPAAAARQVRSQGAPHTW